MACFDAEAIVLLGRRERILDAPALAHLARCPECRRLVALAVRAEEPVAEAKGAARPLDVVGPYVLERRLGAGAMGEVWSARRRQDGVLVALKFPLLPVASDAPSDAATMQARIERARREARLATSLAHPNIVAILDVMPLEGGRAPLVIVMEFLDGETLADRIDELPTHTGNGGAAAGRMRVREACAIGLGLAQALVHAHEKGIVHRDLKPANVMLVGPPPGGVKLLDFGLARPTVWSSLEPRLTVSGAAVGTVATMAPEQAFGVRDVDVRADVWSLGAILYRLLGGVWPIPASTPGELLKLARGGSIVPIEARVPSLPLDLAAIVMQALEIDRSERLVSVAPFVPVLRRHAAS